MIGGGHFFSSFGITRLTDDDRRSGNDIFASDAGGNHRRGKTSEGGCQLRSGALDWKGQFSQLTRERERRIEQVLDGKPSQESCKMRASIKIEGSGRVRQ